MKWHFAVFQDIHFDIESPFHLIKWCTLKFVRTTTMRRLTPNKIIKNAQLADHLIFSSWSSSQFLTNITLDHYHLVLELVLSLLEPDFLILNPSLIGILLSVATWKNKVGFTFAKISHFWQRVRFSNFYFSGCSSKTGCRSRSSMCTVRYR